MTDMQATPLLTLRPPRSEDGAAMYRLADESNVLDVNSAYAYVLLAHHFATTSTIAEDEEGVIGFVTAYHPPEQPDTLFVWQVCVAERARGRGVSGAMLDSLVRRAGREIFVEATVAPSNAASRAMFASLARRNNTAIVEAEGFSASLFPTAHEDEPIVRVGPIAP